MCLIWKILKKTQGRRVVTKCLYLSWSAMPVFSSYPTFAAQDLLVRNKPNSGDKSGRSADGRFAVKGQHWAMKCG